MNNIKKTQDEVFLGWQALGQIHNQVSDQARKKATHHIWLPVQILFRHHIRDEIRWQFWEQFHSFVTS